MRDTTSPTSPSSTAASSPPARPTPSSSSPPAAPLPPPLLFILIALLLVFTAFAFVVTNLGAGSVVSGRGYREYRLGEYSTWLQRRVEDADNWARIRSCLRDGSVCQRFDARGESLQQFVTNNLSPIQVASPSPSRSINPRSFAVRALLLLVGIWGRIDWSPGDAKLHLH
ncbi:hypothetical protein ZWY2020_005666 [Hordeum vulgare]|nr:hypothetical protein ZWY2020_005666 [Hordeum vulgare]